MMSSFMTINAYAENERRGSAYGDYARVDGTDYQEFLESRTPEQLKQIDQKISLRNSLLQNQYEKENNTKSATKISIPGTFTMYQQETEYYCAPACVKSVLMYINNSSPSQSSIDSFIEQSFVRIPAYMYMNQDECTYILDSSPTQSHITASVYLDVTVEEVPTFIRLQNTTTGSWYGAFAGHCVLANAIYSDYSAIQIADPYGGRVSGYPYFYEKPSWLVSYYTTHIAY